jgi:hypothetical protein
VTDPALSVDAAHDRELLDQEPVAVVPVYRVEQLPWHGVHVAGYSEQLDLICLVPELAPDGLRDDIGPQLGT